MLVRAELVREYITFFKERLPEALRQSSASFCAIPEYLQDTSVFPQHDCTADHDYQVEDEAIYSDEAVLI
jgi:hypothetical protein